MTDTRSVFKKRGDVVLRPVEEDDIEFLQELVQHRDVRNTIGRPPIPVNKKEEEEHIEKVSSNGDAAYFLIEFEGEKAGTISLHGLKSEYRKGEFGISIHPDFHNMGIGTEAVKMIVEYGFDTENLHKIRGGHLEDNIPSRKVMEKAGLQEEGRERDYKYVDGEWKDVIWMSIIEDEYSE
ncbi:MAG: GNAT family N-acetyltransferase [Candidatus Nanohaloarchaea archaeon]